MRIVLMVVPWMVLAPTGSGVAEDPPTLIRMDDLPQDPVVLKAWADAAAQGPFAANWSPEWRHAIPKEAVAKVLSASLSTLRRAANDDKGTELLLAIGIAAASRTT